MPPQGPLSARTHLKSAALSSVLLLFRPALHVVRHYALPLPLAQLLDWQLCKSKAQQPASASDFTTSLPARAQSKRGYARAVVTLLDRGKPAVSVTVARSLVQADLRVLVLKEDRPLSTEDCQS